jgi:hypothetical protein
MLKKKVFILLSSFFFFMVPRLFVSTSRCGSLVLYALAKNDVAKKPASGRTDIVMDKWPTSSAHYREGNDKQGHPSRVSDLPGHLNNSLYLIILPIL